MQLITLATLASSLSNLLYLSSRTRLVSIFDVAPKNRSIVNERFVLKLNLNHNMNHEKWLIVL